MSESVKQSLHDIIDEIEDLELLNLHLQLLQKETKGSFFKTNENDMIARNEQSLNAVREGRTRPIESFMEEVEQWKKNRST